VLTNTQTLTHTCDHLYQTIVHDEIHWNCLVSTINTQQQHSLFTDNKDQAPDRSRLFNKYDL